MLTLPTALTAVFARTAAWACWFSVLVLTAVTVLEKHDQLVREIIGADEIARLRDQCVSTPSLLLTKKELQLLHVQSFS